MNAARRVSEVARGVYEQTASFYEDIEQELGEEAHGFRVLYGPPIVRPGFLFIGFQPGKGAAFKLDEAIEQGEHTTWPERCVYSYEPWPLARNLRRMFGEDAITQSTGLNAIFVRARTVSDYSRLSKGLRVRINAFSMERAQLLTEVMEPQRAVAIGLDTLRMFGPTKPDLKNDKGRTLTETGKIGNVSAIATLHLSGAQISTSDRAAIANRVMDFRS